ncbi:MAG: ABC transporter ATP-binding protein [Phycisphaerae bacterium]
MIQSQSVISVVGLTKVFRDFWQRARVRAVSDLDFHVQPGEIFGLLGPNGSGKSTTIKMILGLLHPTRGRITVFGKAPDDVRIKSRIGYLPEESYLYRFLNARETLDYYGTLFQLHRRERRKRSEELLEMVGLKSAARRPVGEYSKGMARRIGLAQALINDPDLLILDEPTSGLDPVGAKLVKDIIVRIGQVYKKTILLSSHLLADVEEVCGRVTILFGGKTQLSGTMQEVLERRDLIQITCERLSEQTIGEIESLIEQREGKAITVGAPRDRLESLFLRIVQQAHAERVETAGSAAPGEIAGFLGGAAAGREVLESLVRVEEVAPPAEAAAPGPPRVDVLGELTGAAETPPPKPTPAPRAAPAGAAPRKHDDERVDRSLLSELSGDKPEDKG